MDLPILKILQEAKIHNQLPIPFDTECDQWEKDIELYAPGYLGMEAEGKASEYDIQNLRDIELVILAGAVRLHYAP